jgi:hypothetical protein
METDKVTRMVEVFPMEAERLVIPGIVKNGLVVPQNDTSLPDGAHVDIILGPADVPPSCRRNGTSGKRPATQPGP